MPRTLRLLAPVLATLAGIVAVAMAALRVAEGPRLPSPPMLTEPVPPAAAPPATAEPTGDWPALFGTADAPDVDVTVPASPAEPEGTYTLRGIVTSGETGWAIVADGGRDVLVRPGDEIEPGWTVDAIEPDRVIIASGEDEAVIGFAEGDEVRTVEVAEEAESGGGIRPAQAIRTPVASPSELRDMILRAEAERVARGLAAPPSQTR